VLSLFWNFNKETKQSLFFLVDDDDSVYKMKMMIVMGFPVKKDSFLPETEMGHASGISICVHFPLQLSGF
jgi:hypothetical protein